MFNFDLSSLEETTKEANKIAENRHDELIEVLNRIAIELFNIKSAIFSIQDKPL